MQACTPPNGGSTLPLALSFWQMINNRWLCMKMCTVIIVAMTWCLTHLWRLGLHVWDCVLDRALQNSNTPSKDTAVHLYSKWPTKAKHMSPEHCKWNLAEKATGEIKARTITLALFLPPSLWSCFSLHLSGVIYSSLNLCSQAMFDFTWCRQSCCNRIFGEKRTKECLICTDQL